MKNSVSIFCLGIASFIILTAPFKGIAQQNKSCEKNSLNDFKNYRTAIMTDRTTRDYWNVLFLSEIFDDSKWSVAQKEEKMLHYISKRDNEQKRVKSIDGINIDCNEEGRSRIIVRFKRYADIPVIGYLDYAFSDRKLTDIVILTSDFTVEAFPLKDLVFSDYEEP